MEFYVSDLDVSSGTSLSRTFQDCLLLTAIAADQWDISNFTSMSNMFLNVTLDTDNYDAILISWAAQTVQSNVVFHAGNSKYTGGGAVAAARAVLTGAPNNWVIADGGIA